MKFPLLNLRLAIIGVFLGMISASFAADPSWLSQVPAPTPGSFPLPNGRQLNYTGGWGKIPAGKVGITFSQKGGKQTLHFTGTTIGVARGLFRLDATGVAQCDPVTFAPSTTVIDETYSDEKRHTVQTFTPQSVTRERTSQPPQKDDGKVKVYNLPHVFDLQSSMLYLRSQPLKNGDKVTFLTYATGSPYIAKVSVVGREEIEVRAGKFKAIKLHLNLVGIDKNLNLKPYKRAKNIHAWVSDDGDRNYLKISAGMLIGTVFVELDK
ncbi:MAG TPA: DUF3108 domain-containing protein [Chthoniobacterales bacterium]|jgi:hypothetical protein